MNNSEKCLGRELLNALEEKDLIELSRTVTKGKFDAADKPEAVELILQYEVDVRTLLSRKKISTNLLTQYLHYKGVEFSIDAHKHALSDIIVKYWNSLTRPNSNNLIVCGKFAPSQNSLPQYNNAAENNPAVQVQYYNNAAIASADDLNGQLCNTADVTSVNDSSMQRYNQCGAVALCESDVRILGEQFINWFYSQLRGPDLELRSVGAEHFFTDASCKILVGNHVQEGAGSEGCAAAIEVALKSTGHSVPVPNMTGVRSQASPHGAVKVLVCGTLHARPVRMLGAFEQAFLLARDPATPDNWKIKYTELRLNTDHSSVREIEPTSTAPPCIQYDQC